MSEVEVKQTTEESAPVSEVLGNEPPAEDISKKYSRGEVARMRQSYVKNRRDEIEVLELDVKFMDLQVRHYELSKHIASINAEAKEAAAKEESQKFADKISI